MVFDTNCREYSTVIGSDRHTNWGDWHNPVFCPEYSFAVGIHVKFERYHWGDNTYLNAIRLICDDTASTQIQSGEGAFGSWYTKKSGAKRSIRNTNSSVSARRFSALIKFLPDILGLVGKAAQVALFFSKEKLSKGCDDMGKFVGFEFEAEPRVRGDDGAGLTIKMNCESGDKVFFSTYASVMERKYTEKFCPDGEAICGIRTQIEPKISGDDTALNNVDFYCCKNYYKLFNIATKRVLDSDFSGKVYTLDTNDSPHQRWQLIRRDDKYFSLKNVKTGLILDSNHNGNVYAYPDYGNDHQKWFKDDKERIVNKATNRALDSDFSGKVYTLAPNDSDHQLWFRQ
ncbi:vitelline membrane outer layer 1-like [Brachionus plicatilis]|uniref:Vitelline membrane outer layer 1-like n=1 Tax=Brachionus plicatilis TaxID=10195 RepID=A0A3M7PCS5_BRAPC|nr:vitelline membrane outer layer 1-like [Brachionus plicatilis]